jgi:hypothetical protein
MGARAVIHQTATNMHWHLYGRSFRVIAIADNADEANAFMARIPGASVLAVDGPLVIIADKEDEGRKL